MGPGPTGSAVRNGRLRRAVAGYLTCRLIPSSSSGQRRIASATEMTRLSVSALSRRRFASSPTSPPHGRGKRSTVAIAREVGCAAFDPVDVAPAAHPDAATVEPSSAAANMQRLRMPIACERDGVHGRSVVRTDVSLTRGRNLYTRSQGGGRDGEGSRLSGEIGVAHGEILRRARCERPQDTKSTVDGGSMKPTALRRRASCSAPGTALMLRASSPGRWAAATTISA